MKIYAEWEIYGEFDNGFFSSWQALQEATFSPDCNILFVADKFPVKNPPRKREGVATK